MLVKHPEKIIPSHGLYAILEMIKEQKLKKVVAFLECDNVEQGIVTFIGELRILNKANPDYLEILPSLRETNSAVSVDSPSSPLSETVEINGRTWVIAMQIHYELYYSLAEYNTLKADRSKYIELIKKYFNVGKVTTRYKDIDYNYLEILKTGSGSEKGQLRRQLKQIINSPSVLGEKIVNHVKDLLKNNFDEKM